MCRVDGLVFLIEGNCNCKFNCIKMKYFEIIKKAFFFTKEEGFFAVSYCIWTPMYVLKDLREAGFSEIIKIS
ncbi:hypothetical protein GCM10027286_21970 [Virgibacillus ainsalahensis]